MSTASRGDVSVLRGRQVRAAPSVSVIITSRHRDAAASALDDALASVRAQTLPAWEAIIVDDGAPRPLRPARHDDVVLLRLPAAAPVAARDIGIAIARAPLVAFLDADDRFHPTKLARQLALHAQHPELVLSATASAAAPARVTVDPPRVIGAEITFERLFFACCIPRSSAMLTRGAYHGLRGHVRDRDLHEDYALWLRLALRGRVGYLDEVLVTHRRAATPSPIDEHGVRTALVAEHPELLQEPFVRARLDHDRAHPTGASRARPSMYRRAWLDVARTFLRL